MNPNPQLPHLRIARPVSDLARSTALYRDGLGLQVLGGFRGHQGFDGVMLGWPGAAWHLEFTIEPAQPVRPGPGVEDLLVLYIPEAAAWNDACARMAGAGFERVSSHNPYWEQRGRVFRDHDGYRVVLENGAWVAG